MSSIFKKFYRVPDRHEPSSRGHPKGLVIGDCDTSGELKIGFSFCSKKDLFIRKLAHKIAEGRFKSGKYRANIFNAESVENLIDRLPDGAIELEDIIYQSCEYFSARFDENHIPKQLVSFE